MEGPGIVPGLIALVFAGVTGSLCVAQWRGRFTRSDDPDALTQRVYLFTPVALGAALIGIVFLLLGLGLPLPQVMAPIVFGVALMTMFVGLILWLVQPDRVRPAWQRRQQQGQRSRHAAAISDGDLALDLHARGEPVRAPARYTEIEVAVAEARVLLEQDADVDYVTVFDTRARTGVRIVER